MQCGENSLLGGWDSTCCDNNQCLVGTGYLPRDSILLLTMTGVWWAWSWLIIHISYVEIHYGAKWQAIANDDSGIKLHGHKKDKLVRRVHPERHTNTLPSMLLIRSVSW